MRRKIQVSQNKCIHFCLKLNSRQYIGAKRFKEINWLPTKERVEQLITTKVLYKHIYTNSEYGEWKLVKSQFSKLVSAMAVFKGIFSLLKMKVIYKL